MFIEFSKKIPEPKVLELGTLQSIPGRSTMHKNFVPHAKVFHGSDISAGVDVDFIADVHSLSKFVGNEKYDLVISCSSFEHFKYPHLAALEISKVIKPGGALFIQTHTCFPLHAYPYDYFRFSKEALSGCFGRKNGITVVSSDYEYPCKISSSEIGGGHGSWLNVCLFGIKTSETPLEYVYEFDTEFL
jgi:SAM-dependent methyltransferase